VNGRPLTLRWVGEGWPSDVKRVLREGTPADVLVARAFSEGARRELRGLQIGWVDETGAAEIAGDSFVVSRTGDPQAGRRPRMKNWTPAVVAVAEAVLAGVPAKVDAATEATGLSNGSCGAALKLLTSEGFLERDARRGPRSGRRLEEPGPLLDAYAEAAAEFQGNLSLELGILWDDVVGSLAEVGARLRDGDVPWAATAGVAAHIIAPHLTAVSSADLYVDARTLPELHAIAERVGLDPVEGGRVILRPFPAEVTKRLASERSGLRLAPWPRVYADLLPRGVRGQEAADHLREVISES
jgi:hypothetical protein